MTDNHPITPPPELVQQWASAFYGTTIAPGEAAIDIAIQAAQWGADQELDACVSYVDNSISGNKARALRATRRPMPPSLKEQAYDALDTYIYGEPDPKDKERTYNTIRRALEQLND